MIQNNLPSAIMLAAAGFIIVTATLCLWVRARYRRKVAQLSQELAAAHTVHEQLNAAQQQLQQHHDNEHALQAQLAETEQIITEQQTAQSVLEATLAKLQAKNGQYKTYIGRLELSRMKVFNDLNLSAQKIRQLESALAAQHDNSPSPEAFLTLKAKAHAYKKQVDRLELGRMKIFNDLNLSAQKNRQLEGALAAQHDNSPSPEAFLTLKAQAHAYKKQVDRLELGRMKVFNDLNLSAQKIRQLESTVTEKARQADAATQSLQDLRSKSPVAEPPNVRQPSPVQPTVQPQTSAPDLQALAEQKAALAQLQKEVAAQKNHINRLEYDLEIKNLLIQDSHHEIRAIPAAIVEKQAADEARIAELETKLWGGSQIRTPKTAHQPVPPIPMPPKNTASWLNRLKNKYLVS
jgi:chromosome segregation ATPase